MGLSGEGPASGVPDSGAPVTRVREPQGRRPLEGDRILVTRSPERAGPFVLQLRLAGADPLLLPLKDFERASDQAALDEAFDALRSGQFAWLVVSSATTVLALQVKAAEREVALHQWIPAATRVAAVGPSTAKALEAAGLAVHLVPHSDHSAAGLAGEWPDGPATVLLPQADIAAPALALGLSAKGADVRTVVAYHTVDYPAEPGRRLATPGMPAQGVPSQGVPAGEEKAAGTEAKLLTPAEAKAWISDGGLAAVVAASPSAARSINTMLAPLGACRFVAIGKTTAAQAEALGLTVAATATEATPAGLVAAVIRAVHPDAARTPDIHSTASGTQ
ncbi:uroporphyrinogen-III synthase [Arthrobacter sp. NPDC093139]|uniref:uroporphyrinogen-III synthase n=1 Tax=Arthrobacter sp. NPDC093139 TaxID=3363945 RepID=UPI00382D911A